MSFCDAIDLLTERHAPEALAIVCQHTFRDFDTQAAEVISNRDTTVNMYPYSIDAKHFNHPDFVPDFVRRISMADFGFIPNLTIPIFYSKAEQVWVNHNGQRDIPQLRDVILRGVVGTLKAIEDSLVLRLDNPERHVLIRHAGKLTLMEDRFWTEDRLRLFQDIPYEFKTPQL